MIKQIVFDFGNVLVRFEPTEYLRSFVDSDVDVIALRDMIYLSKPWKDGDLGLCSRQETIDALCAMYPKRAELLRRILANCSSILTMPAQTPTLLERLHKAGLRLFYISNTNPGDYAFMTNAYPVMAALKGIASFREGLLKPDPAIYQLLLDRYKLLANECLFIDDMPVNTQTARSLGFETITLSSADALEKALIEHTEIGRLLRGDKA